MVYFGAEWRHNNNEWGSEILFTLLDGFGNAERESWNKEREREGRVEGDGGREGGKKGIRGERDKEWPWNKVIMWSAATNTPAESSTQTDGHGNHYTHYTHTHTTHTRTHTHTHTHRHTQAHTHTQHNFSFVWIAVSSAVLPINTASAGNGTVICVLLTRDAVLSHTRSINAHHYQMCQVKHGPITYQCWGGLLCLSPLCKHMASIMCHDKPLPSINFQSAHGACFNDCAALRGWT